jgi:hypothetical protein
MSGIFRRFAGKKEAAITPCTSRKPRHLLFEPLEERALLAVTAAEFNQIRDLYPDLNLAASMSSYNVIEIEAAQLSEASLRNAITQAGNTPQNDLIVLRTTETQNKITLGGVELAINIDATKFGSVTIVSLGEERLTIDGDQQSGVMQLGEIKRL